MIPPSDASQPGTPRPKGEGAPRSISQKGRESGARSAQPAILSATPNVFTLLKALSRRWFLGVGLGICLAAIAGTAAWFLLPPPKITVRTKISVPNNSFINDLRTGEPPLDTGAYQKMQMVLCTSPMVLLTALRDREVGQLPLVMNQVEPVAWLESEVRVDFGTAPHVLSISMQGTPADEEALRLLVTALRKAYLSEVVEKARARRQDRLKTLREFREQFERELREMQQDLANLPAGDKKQDLRTRNLAFLQTTLERSEQELLTAQAGRRQADIELTTIEQRMEEAKKAKISEDEVREAVDKEPRIQAHLAEIESLKTLSKKTASRSPQGEKDKSVLGYQNRVKEIQGELDKERKTLQADVIRRLREKMAGDLALQERMTKELQWKLAKTVEILEPAVERLRGTIAKQAEKGAKLDVIDEAAGPISALVRRLAADEQALKIDLAAPSQVEILEELGVVRPDPTKRKLSMAGGAALGGLAFALLAVGWLEYRTRRLDSLDEVVTGLGMRLVGALPDSTRPARGLLRRHAAEQSQQMLTESVDATRAILLYTARQESLRVVLVTSAVAREGKTSLASHLAVSLARAGLRTLLLDGDLRNPMLHRLFQVDNQKGFNELLRGEIDLTEATHPTAFAGLTLIPGGQWDQGSIRALTQGQAGVILDQLRAEFDFILVDSSPVLPVADALLLGQHVDGALISVLRHVSRMPNIYAAAQRIEALGVRTLGVVMNGVSGELYTSTYPHLTEARVKS